MSRYTWAGIAAGGFVGHAIAAIILVQFSWLGWLAMIGAVLYGAWFKRCVEDGSWILWPNKWHEERMKDFK